MLSVCRRPVFSENQIKLSIDDLIQKIEAGALTEVLADRVEFKSSWHQDYGKDICAISNHESLVGGWLVVGLNDRGELLNRDQSWLKQTEDQVSNHCLRYLSPSWAAVHISGRQLANGYLLFIDIVNPGEVVTWNGRAYKLSGTISQEMPPDEQLSLSMRLPGEDYSRQSWSGTIDGALVLDFAKKVKEEDPSGNELFGDLQKLSPSDVLSKLGINDTTAAGILFGNFKVRVVHYDINNDVLDQQERVGAYGILADAFIEHIQSWTRRQGTVIQGQSTSAAEEVPYPIKALREVLANAVAHTLYARDQGNILVELRPNRFTLQNNCSLESKAFANKWFSKGSAVKNKLLMTVLRIAKITDELGSGKNRIFRQMIESGRREPVVEFSEVNRYGRWAVTLYNEESNRSLQTLIGRLQGFFSDPDYWRIATALVLWRDNLWSEIKGRLDEHYNRVALAVLQDDMSPIIVVNDKLFLKRWADVTLTGQLSRRFSPAEEEQIKQILKAYGFSGNRGGHVTTTDARRIIGLSDAQSETVQLSNLFRKWSEAHIMTMVKRGHWRFLTDGEHSTQVIMSLFQSVTAVKKPSSGT